MLAHARLAFERRAWTEAYEQLRAAERESGLEPDDLERLATAAYLSGRDEQATDAWTRAHQSRLDRGEHKQAVRCAFWLAFGLMQRGDMAQGSGWLARAQRLLEQYRVEGAERGYLLLPQALMALDAGDSRSALQGFAEITRLAEIFGDPDLAALGAVGRGQSLLGLRQGREGMRLFDEAMVSVTSGETSPVVSGIVYCAVIDACQRAFDVARAGEWTAALEHWCEEQQDLVPYRGQCLVHRAQIMQFRGEWAEAATEAELACARLTDPPHPAVGMAHYQLGELHRLRGQFPEADAAYRQAHGCGHDPQPGLALLRLAEGRLQPAITSIQRALDAAHGDVARARLLPAYVEIMLRGERTTEARVAAEELAELAKGIDTALLRALASQSRGAVLLAEGDPRAALDRLREAYQAWHEIGAPYEAAQARILMAAACRAVDDHETAELECDAAREALEQLGAGPALARLRALVAAAPAHTPPLPVTARELEVLRLVATGRANREIADELVISEKTVERHLSNIFTKLGVSNRAAATAYAYEHQLL